MDKTKELLIREMLLKQREEIADEMKRHGGTLKPDTMSDLRDPEERATALADLWIDDRIAANDRNLLEKIDFALKRLDEGTYDICTECQAKIPVARLLAKPSASLCVACQEDKAG